MRRFTRVRIAIAGVVAAAILAGCGSSGTLLSASVAGQLKGDLSQASSALGRGDCQVARSALNNFRTSVGQLQNVDGTLLQMLTNGAATISNLAASRCPTRTTTTTTPTTTRTHTHTVATTTTVSTVTSTTTTTAPATVTNVTTTSSSGGAAPSSVTTGAASTTVVTPTVTAPSSGGAGLNSGSAPGAGGPGNGQ